MREAHLIHKGDFDTSVKPTDDFFRFVNGNWLKNNPIPEDEARWGVFNILRYQVEQQLKDILDELVGNHHYAKGTDEQKILDFYETAMNTEKLNALGTKPLDALLTMVSNINDNSDLCRVVARLHRSGIDVWWKPSVEQDEKMSEAMSLHLYQGGLGLPDRDYYIKDDSKSKEIRDTYLRYMQDMFGYFLPDVHDGAEFARRVMNIETSLARSSMTRTERRDAEKQYNKMTLAELTRKTSRIDWLAYFKELRAPAMEYLIVCQPEFFMEADRLFAAILLEDIKIYLQWQIINGMGEYVSEDIERKSFDFYGRIFGGADEMKPRWRRVLRVLSRALDHQVGKLYVERHFTEKAKAKIDDLVNHLISAYRVRIGQLDWMGRETKEKAIKKLGAISKKLGYPDMWKDSKMLEIQTDSYAENYLRAYMFEFDREIQKIGKLVDRSEWFIPPQTVNAYYSPTMNEIVFPAAILQAPFFDPDADDAINFGGIGGVIGHELTHGFDDQGSKFDGNGNLKEWWTNEDKGRFEERTNYLAKQFDTYEPLPEVYINGRLTLGENIADLGGLLIAYDGLQLIIQEKGASELIDGLAPNQRFFINWAIIWRAHSREAFLHTQLQTDPHAPEYYRVNGPLSNLSEFYDAFEGKPGDQLWHDPGDRVKIW